MKIIIAGDGKIGSTLTKQLSQEGYDITLIDSNNRVLETSEEQYDIWLCRETVHQWRYWSVQV